MRLTTRTPSAVVATSGRSDARLALGTVVAAAAGFALLVLLPSAVTDFAPPAGTDVVWRLGGPLVLVLGPTAAGLAGLVSWVSLWARGDLDDTTRRLHLVVLFAVATFAALIASTTGQAAFAWWQD